MTDYPGSDDGRYGPRYGDAGWHRSAGRPRRPAAHRRAPAGLAEEPAGGKVGVLPAGFVLAAILT